MSAVGWPHGPGCRICVSLAEPDPAALRARFDEIEAGPLAGADLVEVRLDALAPEHRLTDELLEELVTRCPVPVGFTLRPTSQGGAYSGDEEDRRAALERAARAAPGFVDVELEAAWAGDFVAASPAPVVVSHHWRQAGVPEDLEERVAAARRLAPAMVKLVATAADVDDAVELLQAGRELVAAGQPATCFCMGAAGRASRLLAAAHGAALIYAAAGEGAEVAPGQWPLAKLRDDLGVGQWPARAEIYGVIGDPIEHSLSPAIFNEVFRERDEGRVYVPLPGAHLDAVLRLAAAADVRGVSVTMPFKERMAARSQARDALVHATGAANTVVFEAGGWAAYNTDGHAVVEALATHRSLQGARVVLIGAGGAARGAAAALVSAEATVTIVNRSEERARRVAEELGIACGPMSLLAGERFDVVINATPVGMAGSGHEDETPFPVDLLAGDEIVFDMVYRPLRTPLLEAAAARGCTIVDGLEMFARQAAAQYRLLTGERQDPPLDMMRATAARFLGQDRDRPQEPRAGGEA